MSKKDKMKISQEFISAMNGVLNGEKWRRKKWTEHEYVYQYMDLILLRYLSFESDDSFNRKYKDTPDIHFANMVATDWIKVE